MRLATFERDGTTSWGVVEGEAIADVGSVLRGRFPDLKAVLAANALGSVADAARGATRYPLTSLSWLPVIPNPDKILCVGLNYEDHRRETGRAEVGNPTIFGRFANSQIGHGADMIRPKVSVEFDYEGELAVVIGTPGRYISQAQSWNHIAGYAVYNEGSIRDYQRHTHQFTPGKNFPGTGAFGPWMMTPDELGPLPDLRSADARQRPSGAGCDARADDLRYPAPDRILLGLHAARARRRHRHGHARRRRRQAQSAAVAEARRRCRSRDRTARPAPQRHRRRGLSSGGGPAHDVGRRRLMQAGQARRGPVVLREVRGVALDLRLDGRDIRGDLLRRKP